MGSFGFDKYGNRFTGSAGSVFEWNGFNFGGRSSFISNYFFQYLWSSYIDTTPVYKAFRAWEPNFPLPPDYYGH